MTARDNTRSRELATIHIAKKQLGLDDETYRDMLWTVARVRSSAALDFAGRKNVLDHLKARGFKSAPGKRAHEGRPRNIEGSERSPQLKKVEALLADGKPERACKLPNDELLHGLREGDMIKRADVLAVEMIASRRQPERARSTPNRSESSQPQETRSDAHRYRRR